MLVEKAGDAWGPPRPATWPHHAVTFPRLTVLTLAAEGFLFGIEPQTMDCVNISHGSTVILLGHPYSFGHL